MPEQPAPLVTTSLAAVGPVTVDLAAVPRGTRPATGGLVVRSRGTGHLEGGDLVADTDVVEPAR